MQMRKTDYETAIDTFIKTLEAQIIEPTEDVVRTLRRMRKLRLPRDIEEDTIQSLGKTTTLVVVDAPL